jgi:RNA polymerase sigma-70 factor (ECF subfamily)
MRIAMATPEQPSSSANTAGPSDHSLLQRYRRGSQDAATQLYLRYAQRLRGLARAQLSPALAGRIDLDDVVQSVFGSFFRRASDGYYDVPVGEELWRLFLVLALHKVRGQAAFHRAARRDVGRTVGIEEGGTAEPDDGGDAEALALLQVSIAEVLERLPAPQRQMVELRIEGFEVSDIAEKVGRSKRTTERLLQEARERLRGLLQEG